MPTRPDLSVARVLEEERSERNERKHAMPEFMDVHTTMKGVTPEALNEAHDADLAIQGGEGSPSNKPGRPGERDGLLPVGSTRR